MNRNQPFISFLPHAASVAGMVLALSFLLAPAFAQEKKIKVETSVTVDEVEPGDEFTMRIMVQGYSEIVNQPLPLDLVLVIALGSPMDEERMRMLRGAAVRLIQLAEREGARGSPAAIRIGLISLSSPAEWMAAPSNHYEALKTSVERIPPPAPMEASSLLDGMRRAQGFLSSSPNPYRAVVLLSESGLNLAADPKGVETWFSLLRESQEAAIRYYTVELEGGAPSGLLYAMADNTGGNYYHLASVHHLEAAVSDIFAHAAYHRAASHVVLRKQVNLSGFEIIPDSFEFSEGMLLPPVVDLNTFIRTGEIILPMGQLSSNKQRVFGFRLRVKECLSLEHPLESITMEPSRPTSLVSYRYGSGNHQEAIPTPALRCFKLSGLYFRKDYDEERGEIALTLQSTYRRSAGIDNVVRNIRIYEYPSYHYQYIPGSALPPVERFIPGPHSDLLYWHVPQLAPQEKLELRYRVVLTAYRPRDANPLRLGAERRPEGCEPWAEFVLPDKQIQKVLLPQKFRYVPQLPFIPEKRPDLYITPPMDEEKFYSRIPEEIDLSHIPIPPEGLAALWPFPQNPFPGRGTPDLWIDSEKNGFVTRWTPETDPEVIAHIKTHIQNVILAPSGTAFRGIEGQGDLFHRKQKNRVYIRIYNVGEGRSPRIADGLTLSIFNFKGNDWEILRSVDLPEMPPGPSASQILSIELPPDILKDAWLQPFGGPGKGAWTALLKVSLTPSSNEMHTNNNTATEKIFVVN